jgi:hypothetical protein
MRTPVQGQPRKKVCETLISIAGHSGKKKKGINFKIPRRMKVKTQYSRTCAIQQKWY